MGYNANLHVFFEVDHSEIELNLKFRDYLRACLDVRNAYVSLKMKILESEDAHQKSKKPPLPIPSEKEVIII